MQLQTVLCYSYTYDMIVITQCLKSNINYTQPQDQHPHPPLVKNSGYAPVRDLKQSSILSQVVVNKAHQRMRVHLNSQSSLTY
jgi:hypothetical protein